MDLSLCITCMNRFQQISETLKKNLDDNKNCKFNIEFILVDFGSIDGLKDFVLNNFSNELESNYLKYYYTEELKYWYSPIAKNTSHLLANGKYLINLDCDNFTGKNYADWIISKFKEHGDNIIIHQSLNIFGSGTMGKISISRENFIKIGGYNQNLLPMSHQDGELIKRAVKNNIKYFNFKNKEFNKTIINNKKESLKNCYGNLNYSKMMKINMIYSDFCLESKQLIANNYFKNPILGVTQNIYRYYPDKIIKLV